jgi:hypothetical protein
MLYVPYDGQPDTTQSMAGFRIKVVFRGKNVHCDSSLSRDVYGKNLITGDSVPELKVAHKPTLAITRTTPPLVNDQRDLNPKKLYLNENQEILLEEYNVDFDGAKGDTIWSSTGTGQFVPNATKPDKYIPSEADNLQDSIVLTYKARSWNANQTAVCMERPALLNIIIRQVKPPKAMHPGVQDANNPHGNTFWVEGLPDFSHLRVFDRWGRVVLDKRDYVNGSWDGGSLEAGVYFYELTYKLGHKNGSIQILR